MKKIFFLAAILLSSFLITDVNAQIRVGFNINIGEQPIWGPVGYDHVEYYYMPDIDAYYYVPRHQYIYMEGGRWLFSASLPGRFNNYDINSGYKVVINDRSPYRRDDFYKRRYSNFKGNRGQQIIRNSNDEKYFKVKGHPQYDNWKKHQNQNSNRGFNGNNGRGRSNEKERNDARGNDGNNGRGNNNKGNNGKGNDGNKGRGNDNGKHKGNRDN